MSTARGRVYECIGGPLCGTKADDSHDFGKFIYGDEDGRQHFYRLVRIETNDHSAGYTFFHYFGSNAKIALKASPVFVPYKQLARVKKRK